MATSKVTNNLCIKAIVQKGGIVGRGVLLDYAAYCKRHAISLSPLSSASIPLSDLLRLVAEEGITIRQGDILFIRAGFTVAYDALDQDAQKALAVRPTPDFLGLEPSANALRWLWDSGFSAVASDVPSFERAPVAGEHTLPGGVWAGEPWEEEMQGGGLLHQWLLGGWGMPIGEMFDLEALSRKCKELGRWSFFVSSMPLNVSWRGSLTARFCVPFFFANVLRNLSYTDFTAITGSWWRGEPP